MIIYKCTKISIIITMDEISESSRLALIFILIKFRNCFKQPMISIKFI
jgi:hypothetical protein